MMVEIRDKGQIPLNRPDVKIRGGIDPRTGNVFAVFLDFQAHEAVIWWQPTGWLPKQPYGHVNLVDFDAYPHDGHFKVLGHTWKDDGGDVPGDHFVVLDLGPIPA
jgi:hypothetical protein